MSAINDSRLVLLNSSILTEFGTYRYEPVSLAAAKALLHEFNDTKRTIESAIGHQPTAELLTSLLEFPVAVNRIQFQQAVGDTALVFKLRQRLHDIKVLSQEEIKNIGYGVWFIRRAFMISSFARPRSQPGRLGRTGDTSCPDG